MNEEFMNNVNISVDEYDKLRSDSKILSEMQSKSFAFGKLNYIGFEKTIEVLDKDEVVKQLNQEYQDLFNDHDLLKMDLKDVNLKCQKLQYELMPYKRFVENIQEMVDELTKKHWLAMFFVPLKERISELKTRMEHLIKDVENRAFWNNAKND